ncbi:hypothetical protein G2W53_040848 [Senna tora]|uniref:Reverse transcriptase zinc-binding domain-containing protein n=1 Tax=Senna tora TaxID=362788 RepID=A0A834SIY9_9FABA|nr:hypothetical protein G2W53_040848 [Senna tora]
MGVIVVSYFEARELRRGRWRMDVLRQNFLDAEVDAIMNLPHNSRRYAERWAWNLTSNGVFSVKTAYHAAHNRNQEQTTEVEYCNLWKKIQRMTTSPSIKLFLWRAVKDILPTGHVLDRQGMEVEGTCVWFKLEIETAFLAIIGCDELHQFWEGTKLPFITKRDYETVFKEWLNVAITQWTQKNWTEISPGGPTAC